MTAQYVRSLTGFRGNAALYKLDPPFKATGYDGSPAGEHEYVVASAVYAYSGPETLVFPANAEGEVVSWLAIGGSRGYMDHQAALAEMGNYSRC